MKSLVIRILRQMGNDRRTLVLMIAAPILILSLLYLLLGEGSYIPKISVSNDFPAALLTELKKQDVEVSVLAHDLDMDIDIGGNIDADTNAAGVTVSSADTNAGTASGTKSGTDTGAGIDTVSESDAYADALLKDKTTDAVVTVDKDGMHIRMLESGSSKAASVTTAIKNAAAAVSPASSMNLSFVYGKVDSTSFNSLGYVLLGVLSFFFVFIISGISFVRERETGTLERLMATPIRRMSVVGGYTLGFGILAAVQSVLMILFSRYVLGMEFQGPVWLAMLIMVLLAFTAVSLGAFVSIFANNEFQVMQFIPLIIVPQMFFSGLITIDTLPYGLGNISYFMPIYYGCSGLEKIMIKGFGFEGIWKELCMLLAFILVLFALNVLALKKYRKL